MLSFNTHELIVYGGLLIVFLAIYGQIGLFFCFFIPSGAFLFALGAMIATGDLNYELWTAGGILSFAAILGNITGYLLGMKMGVLLYKRPNSRFFKQEHLNAARHFYDKHGGQALAFGLFLPIVRTFAPIVAGIVRLKIRQFLFFITIGSVAWIFSFLLAGYLIGSRPGFKPYLNYIVTGIVIVVSIPVVIRIYKEIRKEMQRKRLP